MKTNRKTLEERTDEIALGKLFVVVWEQKITVIVVSLIFAFAASIYAISIPNQYTATVVLAPSQSESGGLSGALGQLGGLASLAGVNIGSNESSEAQIAQQIMISWDFIDKFIRKNKLEKEIYAVDGWDSESNLLVLNERLYDVANKSWAIKDNDILRAPTSWELYKAFREMLNVVEDKKTGLVSVSIEYYSPLLAKAWLDMYLKSINIHMQQRQIVKVTRNIAYLEKQIEKTSIAEMQGVFYTIIEGQIKSKMLAEASPDYAFATVNPSMVPEEKSQPQRALLVILCAIFGAILSLAWVLIKYSLEVRSS
ncbi:MAG: Wzz/FepE/Etk N-terminal domain-containing protein [Porticoccaceae bacterium]|nr:Wzz/FepE/Etk N-terminal domain-containing protein [Porticoccaceae bacterium]MDG1474699.1 Wzz/FepE/Etk N-terminal domain-containing protein [Porticoccaceae bacterium]